MRLSHWILVVSLLSFPLDSFADIEGRYDLDTKEFLKRITLQLKAEKSAKKADLKKKLNLYTKMFNKVKQ